MVRFGYAVGRRMSLGRVAKARQCSCWRASSGPRRSRSPGSGRRRRGTRRRRSGAWRSCRARSTGARGGCAGARREASGRGGCRRGSGCPRGGGELLGELVGRALLGGERVVRLRRPGRRTSRRRAAGTAIAVPRRAAEAAAPCEPAAEPAADVPVSTPPPGGGASTSGRRGLLPPRASTAGRAPRHGAGRGGGSGDQAAELERPDRGAVEQAEQRLVAVVVRVAAHAPRAARLDAPEREAGPLPPRQRAGPALREPVRAGAVAGALGEHARDRLAVVVDRPPPGRAVRAPSRRP